MGGSVRKHDRVIEIYSRLVAGEVLHKEELAKEYGVNPRSIQRDIDSIREFYSNRTTQGGGIAEIRYDYIAKGFRLYNENTMTLSNEEFFSIVKIILESRSLSKAEVQKLIPHLAEISLPTSEKKKVSDFIRNKLFYYMEPHHGKDMIPLLWELGNAIAQRRIVQLNYQPPDRDLITVSVRPVGITQFEYYFYLITFPENGIKAGPSYPTLYRIDQITDFTVTDRSFKVPQKALFDEGELRKRIAFVKSGPLYRTQFIYKGADLNAILDRFPASECKLRKDGTYLIKTEMYGEEEFENWLQSQGDDVEVVHG